MEDQQSADPRVPITLLTGFLGAGKTTLVNRLLSDPASGRVAVIVNEFGEVGIDGALIERASEDVLELRNGCICCSAREGLLDALRSLYLRKLGAIEPKIEFDKILVETTGIADPTPLARLLYTDLNMNLSYRLDAVVTVVDLKHIRVQLAAAPEAKRQIALADKILFTKRDLTTEDEYQAARAAVAALNPIAPTALVAFGDIEPRRVLDLDLFDPKLKAEALGEWIGSATSDSHDLAAVARDDVSAICVRDARAVDWERFLRFLWGLSQRYGEDLYRVKAIAHVSNVDRPVIFQGVQSVFSPPTYGDRWPEGVPESRLVVIGRHLDREAILSGFTECLAESTTVLDRSRGAI